MSKIEDRPTAILQAATRTLVRQGLPHLSYDAIAQEAGLSRQLVRYHFSDPDALHVALVDHLADAYRNILVSGVVDIARTERLSFFLDFYFDLLAEHPKPRDDQAYDALFSLATGSTPVRTKLRESYTLLGQVIGIEIQVQYPEISANAAKRLSFLFVSMMYGHWKFVATLGLSEGHSRITRDAIDRLILAYRETPPTELSSELWSPSGL